MFFQKKESASLPTLESSKTFSSIHTNKRTYSKKIIYSVIGFVVLIVAFSIFTLMKSVTVTYVPKSTDISFSKDSFTAYRLGGDGKLAFSVIKLASDKGLETPASGQEQVSIKASGKAIVYNNSGTAPQKLVKNTRFQTTDGKVYRIQSDISVPGKTGTTPGSLEVTLYADQPGADYNIPLSDFTLLGLKGDPKFTTVYARSKTPMSGGFVGLSKKVSDADLTTAKTSLEAGLKDSLLTEAKAQVPSDYVLFTNLVQISYSDLPQSAPTDKGVTVNRHAEFSGVMFRKEDLSTFLASKKLTGATNVQGISFTNLESLDFAFATGTQIDLLKADSLNFTVSGDTKAVYFVPEEALKSDLAGISKNTLTDILKNYPTIETATAVIHPFWSGSFPNDPSKIKIVKQAGF